MSVKAIEKEPSQKREDTKKPAKTNASAPNAVSAQSNELRSVLSSGGPLTSSLNPGGGVGASDTQQSSGSEGGGEWTDAHGVLYLVGSEGWLSLDELRNHADTLPEEERASFNANGILRLEKMYEVKPGTWTHESSLDAVLEGMTEDEVSAFYERRSGAIAFIQEELHHDAVTAARTGTQSAVDKGLESAGHADRNMEAQEQVHGAVKDAERGANHAIVDSIKHKSSGRDQMQDFYLQALGEPEHLLRSHYAEAEKLVVKWGSEYWIRAEYSKMKDNEGRSAAMAWREELRQNASQNPTRDLIPDRFFQHAWGEELVTFQRRIDDLVDDIGSKYQEQEERRILKRMKNDGSYSKEAYNEKVNESRLQKLDELIGNRDKYVQRYIIDRIEDYRFHFERQDVPGWEASWKDEGIYPKRPDHGQERQDYSVKSKDFDLPVAQVIVDMNNALKELSPVDFDFKQYESKSDPHYLLEFSIDVYPNIEVDDRGFYERPEIIDFFLAVDEATKRPDVNAEWGARYNDFDTAKGVNEAVGSRRIDHVRFHGPAPYKHHIHFDFVPRDPVSPTKPKGPPKT